MKTAIVKIEKGEDSPDLIRRAGQIIRAGGLVAFPTETVYGLGGDALNPDSSRKIYAAKGRPSDNPLIIHICRIEDLEVIAEEIPEAAARLAEAFWPGPLTMVLRKSNRVPLETTGGLSTVAVRMPGHECALAFIREAGGFVAAPSANLSGRPSPTQARYVIEDMDGRVDMILDGGQVGIGLESTIIDLSCEPPTLLRPGYITLDMLQAVIGKVEQDGAMMRGDSAEPPKAPGMKYRHYSPKGDLTIISGQQEKVTARINQLSQRMREKGERVGIIGTDSSVAFYNGDSIKSAGDRADQEAVAGCLYRILREFDDEGITVIYSESFSSSGLGQAIMNRLLKAAGYHIEYV